MDFFRNFVKLSGGYIYYEIIGDDKGHPLTLLHSGYTDFRIWDYQIRDLAKYYKVIRYDIRGFGRSVIPNEPFYHYQDLYELLKFLEIQSTILVGISMGGSIATDFTLIYPEMVDALILSGSSLTGYKNMVSDNEQNLRHEAGLSIIKRDSKFEESLDILLNDPMWKQSDESKQAYLRQIFSEQSLEWTLNDFVKNTEPPSVDRLAEINAPTLIIQGDQDSSSITEISNYLESNIKNTKKAIIKDTGHLPNFDQPEEFNKIVLDFLLNINLLQQRSM